MENDMNRPGILTIPSMKGRCSDAEWQARVDLAACYRLIDHYGMADMMANHISSHVPGEAGAFLINPYGMMYEEITASCLIKVDLAGNILSKPDFGALDYGINKAGYVIHSAVHAARPEIACVIHTHSWASMAVSALACGLLRGPEHRGAGVAAQGPGRAGGGDLSQPWRHGGRPHRRRGLQLDPPAGAVVPRADRRHVVQHALALGAAGRDGGNLEQLPARYAQALRRDGVAGAAAQARPDGPELPRLSEHQEQETT
jgi:hypothetical protein